jgi:putative intracellular protease/amidase
VLKLNGFLAKANIIECNLLLKLTSLKLTIISVLQVNIQGLLRCFFVLYKIITMKAQLKPSILRQLTSWLMMILVMVTTAYSQSGTNKSQSSPPGKKILIALSAAKNWTRADGTLYPTGYWAEEFVVMHEKFVAAGYDVDLATPGGVKPTADPKSLDPKVAEKAPEYAKYLAQIANDLNHPIPLDKVNMANYAAVVVPGGHGPVEDLYKDKDMGRVLVEADRTNKIIGTVCHGQAALLSAYDEKGQWIFKGRTLTSFSDEEEIEFGTANNAPWLLASRLRQCGANYKRGEKNWGEYIVRDRNLISGQNPASTAPMADAVVEDLKKQFQK